MQGAVSDHCKLYLCRCHCAPPLLLLLLPPLQQIDPDYNQPECCPWR
jgi:hypothetical protein